MTRKKGQGTDMHTPTPNNSQAIPRESIPVTTAMRTSHPSDTMGPFQGTILIEGNRNNPEQTIKAAVDACNYQTTADSIPLSIFADGGFSGRRREGSYAIVWNRPTPGAPTHTQEEEHREAWYAEGPGSINVCELLAVLLALRTLKTETPTDQGSQGAAGR